MKKAMALFLAILIICTLPVSSFAASYVLRLESEGEPVIALQLALSQLGYLKHTYITGYYGELTEDAVKDFQEDRDFSVDGVAGPSTLKSLLGNDYKEFFDLAASRSSSSSSSSSSSNEEDIVQAEVKVSSNGELSGALVMGVTDDLVNLIQERLKTYGFLSIDTTTNYFGEMTEDAVIAFQKANGLTSDGIVGNKTFQMLLSSNAVSKSQAGTSSSSGSSSSSSSSAGGYINMVSGTSSNAAINGIIDLAKAQLGKPYKYNTRGTETFDCSGLVYYCYKNYGYSIPSSSAAQSQYEDGTKIKSISDLRLGDIICFNTGNSHVAINHTGLYIGNGQFIHSSSSAKAVIISNISSGFYEDAFRWAIRIID